MSDTESSLSQVLEVTVLANPINDSIKKLDLENLTFTQISSYKRIFTITNTCN